MMTGEKTSAGFSDIDNARIDFLGQMSNLNDGIQSIAIGSRKKYIEAGMDEHVADHITATIHSMLLQTALARSEQR